MSSVPPKARLFACVVGVASAFIFAHWFPLTIVLGIVLVLLWVTGLAGRYARFAAVVVAPLGLMLSLMWGLVTGAPPGAPLRSDPHAGIAFAAVITLRIAVAAGVLQLCLLSIPPRLLPATLRGWGLRGAHLVAGLGAYAVLPEITLRMDQVLTAYRARGQLAGGRLALLRWFPRLLRPLFVWSIRAAVQRADIWQQRALLLRAERLSERDAEWSRARGVLAVAAALLLLAMAVSLRWKVTFLNGHV